MPLAGLYAITPAVLSDTQQWLSNIELALRGGATVIQYRDKLSTAALRLNLAHELVALCRHYNAISVINDDVQLAKQVQADAVHLGKDDLNITQARTVLGNKIIIGCSCYNQLPLAVKYAAQGANYVAFGAIYASQTKPLAPTANLELIRMAHAKLNIPIVAIGGITLANAAPVIAAGASMLAVIQGVFATTDIETTSNQFSNLFTSTL